MLHSHIFSQEANQKKIKKNMLNKCHSSAMRRLSEREMNSYAEVSEFRMELTSFAQKTK